MNVAALFQQAVEKSSFALAFTLTLHLLPDQTLLHVDVLGAEWRVERVSAPNACFDKPEFDESHHSFLSL